MRMRSTGSMDPQGLHTTSFPSDLGETAWLLSFSSASRKSDRRQGKRLGLAGLAVRLAMWPVGSDTGNAGW